MPRIIFVKGGHCLFATAISPPSSLYVCKKKMAKKRLSESITILRCTHNIKCMWLIKHVQFNPSNGNIESLPYSLLPLLLLLTIIVSFTKANNAWNCLVACFRMFKSIVLLVWSLHSDTIRSNATAAYVT